MTQNQSLSEITSAFEYFSLSDHHPSLELLCRKSQVKRYFLLRREVRISWLSNLLSNRPCHEARLLILKCLHELIRPDTKADEDLIANRNALALLISDTQNWLNILEFYFSVEWHPKNSELVSELALVVDITRQMVRFKNPKITLILENWKSSNGLDYNSLIVQRMSNGVTEGKENWEYLKVLLKMPLLVLRSQGTHMFNLVRCLLLNEGWSNAGKLTQTIPRLHDSLQNNPSRRQSYEKLLQYFYAMSFRDRIIGTLMPELLYLISLLRCSYLVDSNGRDNALFYSIPNDFKNIFTNLERLFNVVALSMNQWVDWMTAAWLCVKRLDNSTTLPSEFKSQKANHLSQITDKMTINQVFSALQILTPLLQRMIVLSESEKARPWVDQMNYLSLFIIHKSQDCISISRRLLDIIAQEISSQWIGKLKDYPEYWLFLPQLLKTFSSELDSAPIGAESSSKALSKLLYCMEVRIIEETEMGKRESLRRRPHSAHLQRSVKSLSSTDCDAFFKELPKIMTECQSMLHKIMDEEMHLALKELIHAMALYLSKIIKPHSPISKITSTKNVKSSQNLRTTKEILPPLKHKPLTSPPLKRVQILQKTVLKKKSQESDKESSSSDHSPITLSS